MTKRNLLRLSIIALHGLSESVYAAGQMPRSGIRYRVTMPDRFCASDMAEKNGMKKLVEIRSYNLKAGSREEFHRLVLGESLPLMKRWSVDVITFGASPHDSNSNYLIRAYKSLADRQSSQDAFYGSPEWRQGPREAIITLIESDTSIVIEMDSAVVDAIRKVV